MITKVQERTLRTSAPPYAGVRLSPLEKAMLRWVTVDDGDRVLDASIGSGAMAEYLRRYMNCEVCGVSDSMEDVREARSRLSSCDIVFAPPSDIPWRGGSFDTVLIKLKWDRDTLMRSLAEARRVLKAGGQLVLGATCCAGAFSRFLGLGADLEASDVPDRRELMAMLDSLSFQNLVWQRTVLGTGVLIGWKRKRDPEELLA